MKLTEQLRTIKLDGQATFDLNKYKRSSISVIMDKLKNEEGIYLTSSKTDRKLTVKRIKP